MLQSDKYWRDNHSEAGTARRKRQDAKRRSDPNCRIIRANNEKERYHRIQDEAGFHSEIRDFYPGFGLLKALENAEVIEI